MIKEVAMKAPSFTSFRRSQGTYTLDMWVPKATDTQDKTKVEPRMAAPAARTMDGPMELDALKGDPHMKEHCVVPIKEWEEYCRYRSNTSSASVFRRPA